METNNFKQELINMDLRLTEMEEKIDSINTKLTQVVDAIIGNPLTKVGGFVSEIDIMKAKIIELEKKQLKYEEFKKKTLWTIAVIMGIGALIQYGTTIYSNVNSVKVKEPTQIKTP